MAAPPTPNLDSNGKDDSQEVAPRPAAQKNASQASDTSDTANAGPALASGTNYKAPTDQPATNGLNEDATAEVLKELEKLLQVFFFFTIFYRIKYTNNCHSRAILQV